MRATAILLLLTTAAGGASRLRELATVEGVRENQLVGYGLVVGLNGTGDRSQTMFSAQSLTNMLERMGVTISPTLITVKNTAAVMVTAALPAFAQPGALIDVTASSIGDSSNLQGGLLVLTSLKGADGQVYALAQGSVLTGGFSAGRGGSTRTLNHPTAGRIPSGATVERAVPAPDLSAHIRLQLRETDFTTASHIAEALNHKFGTVAHADNGRVITVTPPASYSGRTVDFVADLENVEIEVGTPARVLINERTGTIVIGGQVHVAPVAIMHGNLAVEVQTTQMVSQPNPLGQGSTMVVPEEKVAAKEDRAKSLVLKEGATVEELVRALNAVGSTPRDIIAILEALRAAGVLEAEVEVM